MPQLSVILEGHYLEDYLYIFIILQTHVQSYAQIICVLMYNIVLWTSGLRNIGTAPPRPKAMQRWSMLHEINLK